MRMLTRSWRRTRHAIIVAFGVLAASPAAATEDIYPALTAESFVGRWEALAPSTDSYFILSRGRETSSLVLSLGTKVHVFVATGPVAVDQGKFTLRLSPADSRGPFKDVELSGDGVADGASGDGVLTVRITFPGTNRTWASVMFKRMTKAETGVDRLCGAIDAVRAKDEELHPKK